MSSAQLEGQGVRFPATGLRKSEELRSCGT